MSRRTEKIASQLRVEVARVLRQEATDPRIGLVTITRVDVAPDLSNALVYWSVMDADADDTEAVDDALSGLESAAPFLRRRLARTLALRRMPELRFRYDPSLSLGSRTLAVLRDLEAEDDAGGGGMPPTQRGRGTDDETA